MSPVQSGDENIISFVLLGHHATTYLIRVCPDAMIYALMRTKQCRTLSLFINIYFRGFSLSCPPGRRQTTKECIGQIPWPGNNGGRLLVIFIIRCGRDGVNYNWEKRDSRIQLLVQEEGQIPLLLFTSGIIEFKSKWEILVPWMT